MTMQCGVFMTPYNPPNRTPRQVFDWALDIARICDESGYADFMIGEHYTLGWENIPMPEAIIAACAQTTKQIRFAPMAHLLPYHDPATLAVRIGWLSQVMEGRRRTPPRRRASRLRQHLQPAAPAAGGAPPDGASLEA